MFWYAREKADDREQAVQDELSMVKAREEELMMEVCHACHPLMEHRLLHQTYLGVCHRD